MSLDNEEVIHYGIIPRSNRGIFVINELPDLQPRIQVALFNLLQEGDLQIRGYKLRIPVDIQFVFTSNPEDYTNRGSIITPLKDRIQSQIFTHYPLNNALGRAITQQEIKRFKNQENIVVPELMEVLLEQVAIEARKSEYVDVKSGVSARLSITAYENVLSAVERRMLINGLTQDSARISDIYAAIPAIIGKIEINNIKCNGETYNHSEKIIFNRNQNNLTISTSINTFSNKDNFKKYYSLTKEGEKPKWENFIESEISFKE